MTRSVHAIQRAMVRMLFDADFVRAVHAGPVDTLTDAERALLLDIDRRAWTTDRFRRTRGVHALIDEYPVTAACMGVTRMDAFFSSDAFAGSLSTRGSMALAFGAWARPQVGAIALLELAIARARRAEPRPHTGPIVTRPGLEPVHMPTNLLATWTQLRERLGADPARTLAEGWTPIQPPLPASTVEPLLVERGDDGNVGIGGSSPALARLLEFALIGRTLDDLTRKAVDLGCDPPEARALITDLMTDGLLVQP